MSATRPQRIFIADTNPNVREQLAGCLRTRGHDVITAATGEQAFLALRD